VRILDSDLVLSPAFAQIVAGIQTVDGVPGAVAEMQRLKPVWFEAWTEKNFDAREADMRNSLRTSKAPSETIANLASTLRAIDSSRLDGKSFQIYDNTLRALGRKDYSVIDVGAIAEIARKQKRSRVSEHSDTDPGNARFRM
jgi:hypothetical protein